MSESLTDICTLYQNRCLRKHSNENYYFTQKNMQKYASDTLYKWFRKILWKADISHGGKGLGPRVHDLSYPNVWILSDIRSVFIPWNQCHGVDWIYITPFPAL